MTESGKITEERVRAAFAKAVALYSARFAEQGPQIPAPAAEAGVQHVYARNLHRSVDTLAAFKNAEHLIIQENLMGAALEEYMRNKISGGTAVRYGHDDLHADAEQRWFVEAMQVAAQELGVEIPKKESTRNERAR